MKRFFLPEWAPQVAVMLTWPRHDGDFRHTLAAVETNFIALATAIARHEVVHVNVAKDPDRVHWRLIKAGISEDRMRIYVVPSNDVWARDYGPLSVIQDNQILHLDFIFNGWGGKFPAKQDNLLTRRLARQKVWNAPVETIDFVLEGGAVETDGFGTLLTTERCLLNETRNPRLHRNEIESQLRNYLGIERILWLKHGNLIGDDTDGHVDTIARFCSPRLIAYQSCENPYDFHYDELAKLRSELINFRAADGLPYSLLPLPLPAPIYAKDGRRLPAGYANFLIINEAVLVPTYGDASDKVALDRLRSAFPDREVTGIDCRALIEQHGSLHCATMQIPATEPPA